VLRHLGMGWGRGVNKVCIPSVIIQFMGVNYFTIPVNEFLFIYIVLVSCLVPFVIGILLDRPVTGENLMNYPRENETWFTMKLRKHYYQLKINTALIFFVFYFCHIQEWVLFYQKLSITINWRSILLHIFRLLFLWYSGKSAFLSKA